MNKRENKVVIKLGQLTAPYAKLVVDTRTFFEPGVSKNLKEERKWRIKDYVQLAKHFFSSHVFAFSQSDEYNNLRVISLKEEGNTFYFKVNKYLSSSVVSSTTLNIGQRMNGYFVVPFNIDKNDPINELVEDLKRNTSVNHLTTRALVIKSLGDHNYLFSHYLIKKEEKEGKSHLVKLTLVELGPRLDMKLQKIEEGVCSGDVIFHSYVHKTPEEIRDRKRKLQEKEDQRLRRKAEQEENVRNKKNKNKPEASTNKDSDSEEESHSDDFSSSDAESDSGSGSGSGSEA
ncbi:ribosome biogenesis protein SSF1/2 [Nematocida displodere]|uniref:Ribosome biogenesis protein SSF1/2 n=1 Tax=Nematocida displodere TaxID=1805483 RepID=A0A177EGH3_9MICR|nr:ribosome biogenesis protein SSF1/2 [Nematocida displodere]